MFAACGQSAGSSVDSGGGTGDTSSSPSGSLTVIYDGAIGGTIPSWSATDPQPLVIFSSQNAGSKYFTSAKIESTGVLDGIVSDHVVVWGWDAHAAGAPTLLYSGALSAAKIPAWNASTPRPLIMYTTRNGMSGGNVGVSGTINSDGTITQIVADNIWIWGWSTPPEVVYSGVETSAAIPNWNSAMPVPTLFADEYQEQLVRPTTRGADPRQRIDHEHGR